MVVIISDTHRIGVQKNEIYIKIKVIINPSGWQFNRIFRPQNRPPKDGRRPKDERLRVGDELGDDLGHDLGGQKSY